MSNTTFAAYVPAMPYQPVRHTHTGAPTTLEPGTKPVGGPTDLIVMVVCIVGLVAVCLGSRGGR